MVESGRQGKRVPEGAASACQSGLACAAWKSRAKSAASRPATGLDFRVPGPDVAQQDRRAVGVDAQRLGVQVASASPASA